MTTLKPQPNYLPNYFWWIDVLFLSISLGCLFFILLGTRPLFVPDEGRYAEIIREMIASGNYITPHLNGIKYFEKPNLYYWLGSLAVYFNGLNLWSIRSVNAFLAILGCLFTYWVASRCYDRQTGLLAAFILGTSSLYFVMAHMISLDLTISVFIAISLYAFLLAYLESMNIKRKNYLFIAAASAAFAVLTKGLIGIIFPLLIIGLWFLCIRQWQVIKHLYLPFWIVVFLLIAAPWHLLIQWYNPEFFNFYFVEQHFLRYTTNTAGHYQPIWYFIPILMIGFFPWVVFLPQTLIKHLLTLRHKPLNGSTEIFFLLWIFCVFIFFSFSQSKLIPYILPLFPPLAILTARYLTGYKQHPIGIKIGYCSLALFSILIAYLFYWYPNHTALPNPKLAIIYLTIAACVLTIGNSIACLFALRRLSAFSFVMIIITSSLFLLTSLAAMPSIDARSVHSLAQTLKPLLQTEDEVITYNQYYQDLPFYLERRGSILNWQNELSFGMQHQDTKQWMLNDPKFWNRWNSHQRIFVIMSLDEYHQFKIHYPTKPSYIIAKTIVNILISNRKEIG